MDSLRTTFNKGDFLSARIYSDVKGNLCACGGKYSSRETIKKYSIPCCNKCGDNPPLCRITAKIKDINGHERRITIRNSKSGARLKDIFDCIETLNRIKEDIDHGEFDVRAYESKEYQRELEFKNFHEKYIALQKRRCDGGEISPATYSDKVSLARNHLMPWFKNVKINSITSARINEFRDSYTGYSRQRDKSLAELKVILNYAVRIGILKSAPLFEPIAQARMRDNVLTIQECIKIINEVNHEYYKKILWFLRWYPIRPGELRVLRYRDIDFDKGIIVINKHLSLGKELIGRKSLGESNNNQERNLILPLNREAIEIIQSLPTPLNKDAYLFPGVRGLRLGKKTLNKYWNEAQDRLGMPRRHLYEMRHARLFEISEMTGDISKVKRIAGHTSIKTSMKYLRGDVDISSIYKKID